MTDSGAGHIARAIRFLAVCVVRAAVIVAIKPFNINELVTSTEKEAGQ